MAQEDYTAYIEVDPNAHIAVEAGRITFTGLARNEDAYIYRDKGAGHYSGDFRHLLTINITSSDIDGFVYAWVLANAVDDIRGLASAQEDYLGLSLYVNAAGLRIFMDERVGAALYLAPSAFLAFSTPFYLEVVRDESVGTYGTLYCRIYSDAARTDLLETISLTLHKQADFRYQYALNSHNSATLPAISGYVEGLSLFESVRELPLETIEITASRRIMDVSPAREVIAL